MLALVSLLLLLFLLSLLLLLEEAARASTGVDDIVPSKCTSLSSQYNEGNSDAAEDPNIDFDEVDVTMCRRYRRACFRRLESRLETEVLGRTPRSSSSKANSRLTGLTSKTKVTWRYNPMSSYIN